MMMESVKSAGSIAVTTGSQLVTGPCRLHYFSILPAAAASTIRLYDNKLGDASGTLLAEASAGANLIGVAVSLSNPVYARLGISVVVAGTAATGNVHYSLT